MFTSYRSLVSLSIKCIIENLTIYGDKDLQSIKYLPSNIKNRILREFTSSSHYSKNVDLKSILQAVINDKTYRVNLTMVTMDDEILNILSQAKSLKKLYLSGGEFKNKITTEGLLYLLTQLKDLYFLVLSNFDEVTDEVIHCLSHHCPNIIALDIGGSKNVSDIGIESLANLPKLTCLTISHTKVTDKGITFLVKNKTGNKIQELSLDYCKNITEIGLTAIGTYCPNIEVLMFSNCALTQDQTFSSLSDGKFNGIKHMTFTIPW